VIDPEERLFLERGMERLAQRLRGRQIVAERLLEREARLAREPTLARLVATFSKASGGAAT